MISKVMGNSQDRLSAASPTATSVTTKTGKKYSIESISSVSPEGLAIDLSEFSSGLYFVRVHTSSEFELIKVIKQ